MSQMRVADFVVRRLNQLGIDTAFLVTGGGAMHLNDAIGMSNTLKKVFCHHEQAAAMAAEVYARVQNKPALLNVTTGPGGINALNGVFGAYTDSIPMIVVSGQVKRETLRDFNDIPNLRQLGDQEVDILSMAKPITKKCWLLREGKDIIPLIDEAYREAVTGRPGPVWIDIPVDLQGEIIDVPDDHDQAIISGLYEVAASISSDAEKVLSLIEHSHRPVLFGGSGVRIGNAIPEFVKVAETLQIPLVTAWTHDLVETDHPLFAGRPGTIGTRAGNFVVQNADLVIVIGSRLNIRQVSYNWKSFAKNAKIVWIDIDPTEFRKPYVRADLEIIADAKQFLTALLARAETTPKAISHKPWIDWTQAIKRDYSPKPSDYPVSHDRINSYHFIHALFEALHENDIVVCGDATATIVPYQIGRLKKGMRLISNSGSASMGHDIPAAVGAAVAAPGARIVCLAGDGSGMMNIQELQTLSALGGDIKVVILDNDGYLSIKHTQRNFFGREAGSSSASGLSFPDFVAVGRAFGMQAVRIDKEGWMEKLAKFLSIPGPALAAVELDLIQEFEPRLKSKMVDGKIETPDLDDMHPFLDPAKLAAIRAEAAAIRHA
jgi:acetolactate synthase-1/2/3 large subunit